MMLLIKKEQRGWDYKLFADISNKRTSGKSAGSRYEEGMIYIDDNSGSNIDVQIIDLAKTELTIPFSPIKI